MKKPSREGVYREGEAVKAPDSGLCKPLLSSPGKTGTGAPVTEHLRCPLGDELGWYRVYLRPYHWIGVFYF